jgi:hypothetical protein
MGDAGRKIAEMLRQPHGGGLGSSFAVRNNKPQGSCRFPRLALGGVPCSMSSGER